ncbi:MAG: hypothetical protein IID33_08950 [Planctomycetes bacterium]|nr:hypothetical protein [Planctomycetota bacterium]
MIIRGADLNTLLDRSRRAGAGAASLLPGLGGLQAEPQRQAGELVATQQTLALQLPISTPLGMPLVFGLDKFTDLQLAMSLSREPNAAWFGEMKKVVAANPELAPDMQQIMDMDSAQFADALINDVRNMGRNLDVDVAAGPARRISIRIGNQRVRNSTVRAVRRSDARDWGNRLLLAIRRPIHHASPSAGNSPPSASRR